jgi:hypothetical protein
MAPAEADARALRLVVIEEGVRAIASRVLPDGGDETVVVRQDDGEASARWAQRVIGRIAAFERSGRRIAQCLVLLAARLDRQSMASRELVLRALLQRSAATGPSSIVLVADADGAGAEQRHELLTLIETLTSEAKGGSTSILVRFASAARATRPLEPRSGTRHVIPDPRATRSSRRAQG